MVHNRGVVKTSGPYLHRLYTDTTFSPHSSGSSQATEYCWPVQLKR